MYNWVSIYSIAMLWKALIEHRVTTNNDTSNNETNIQFTKKTTKTFAKQIKCVTWLPIKQNTAVFY